MEQPHSASSPVRTILGIVKIIALVFLFLVAVQLVGGTFKALGKDQATSLMDNIKGPFAGLSIGILATVLVQSSSATTAMIVGLVSEQQLDPGVAVFAIMGCNVGTTITNTLVSLAHVRHANEFRRAFAGSTMHDFFNLIAIAVLMPLEIATGWLRSTATWLADMIAGGSSLEFKSPIKTAVKSVAKPVQNFFFEDLGLSAGFAGTLTILFAVALLFFSLMFITRTMRALLAEKLERTLNAALGKSGLLAILIGVLLTVSVQSSSVTTSLMVPLFAAGILKLENGFPVTLGANIGTTVTALIASLAGSATGLMIALVHLLFNITATVLIFPFPPLRRFPIRCAERLADLTLKRRSWAVIYVIVTFVVIPLLGTLIFS